MRLLVILLLLLSWLRIFSSANLSPTFSVYILTLWRKAGFDTHTEQEVFEKLTEYRKDKRL
jgi:hypothetical protein